MADRQEFQQERARILRDPEAGDHTPIGEDPTGAFDFPTDTAESVQADAERPEERSTAAGTEPLAAGYQRPEVEVTAAIVDEGIAITFLIPHGLIGVALSE